MTLYNYCTRCGEELDDELSEKYAESETEVPTMCSECLVEVFQGIPKAIQPVLRNLQEAFRPLAEAVNNIQLGEERNDD